MIGPLLSGLRSGQSGTSSLMQQVISQLTGGQGVAPGGQMAGDDAMPALIQELMRKGGQGQGSDPRVEKFRKTFGRDPASEQELALLDLPALSQVMR